MKRDHTKLLCDFGELSGLFVDSSSLETFLQKIVEMISEHMHSEVCSIYLYYEDTEELVLKATKGLKPSAVGKVKLKLGEGLTGLAVKELRPICEKNASKTPGFKYFPEIGEEPYEFFLAVPILHGQTRIGAMVIQNSKRNYFDQEDIQVLKAITSQLANTIETTKLLMSLHEKQAPPEDTDIFKKLKFVKGKVGSEGFAFAPIFVMETSHLLRLTDKVIAKKQYTLNDFYRAVETTEKQLEELQQHIEERLSDVASLIFSAQILMLKDKGFIESIVQHINHHLNPPEAIVKVVENYASRFDKLPHSYLREKEQDVKDIGRRLLDNLIGTAQKLSDIKGHIIIVQELFPSDILKLSSQEITGLILLSGGVTSHLSILARSLSIPLVIVDEPYFLHIPADTKILLDAEQGNIYVNPAEEIIKSFRDKLNERFYLEKLKGSVMPTTKTKDRTRIKLLANINLLGDLKMACEFKAEGVGLYRTEFPFIIRSDFPTEEEQYVVYKKLVTGMSGKEVTFRTLDIGGDKVLSYYHFEKEENPFLGMRSIRFSLKHKDIFAQQIRAILRAGKDADIKIMFPMISSLDEFLEAKEVVGQCIQDLTKEKVECHRNPQIGLMIELPAVLEIIDVLAHEADFFSIGTNDFIQYMLAVDRTNEKVADLYLPHHPAIFRAFKRVVDAANACKKEVSICGDMAHEEKYVPYFVGLGIRRLSLDSRYIPKIQKFIANIDLRDAKKMTENILSKNRISETTLLL